MAWCRCARICDEILVESEVVEAQDHARLVEHAHDDLLAVDRGQRRHPQVDALAADVERNPAVLRDAMLGDVHVRHHLEASGDRGPDGTGRIRDVMEHAVDPIADAELATGRLDMDVRRLLVEGLEDEEVDVADDGCLFGDGLDIVRAAIGALSIPMEASMAPRRRRCQRLCRCRT